MTKKDYELLAGQLRQAKPTAADGQSMVEGWCRAVLAVSIALRWDNHRFDAALFYKAAGLELEEEDF